MNKELLEKGVGVQDTPEENNYQRYLEMGGIINEKDYNGALEKAKRVTTLDATRAQQVKNLAEPAGIELSNPEDKRIKLYWVLQELKPKEIKDSDFRLFREVLRMLEDIDALAKLKATYHTNRLLGTYCVLCQQTKYSEDCP